MKLVWKLGFTVYSGMPSTKPEFETGMVWECSSVKRHEVFVKTDSPSEFVVVHFPDRFKFLCQATSRHDEVVNESLDDSASEHHRSGCCPTPIHHNTADRPLSRLSSSIPSPERLFLPTPRGFNSAIDVETWHQFVHFSSTMNRPRRTAA